MTRKILRDIIIKYTDSYAHLGCLERFLTVMGENMSTSKSRNTARTVAQRNARKVARRRRLRLQLSCVGLALVLAALVAVAILINRPESSRASNIQLRDVTLEAGQALSPEQFLKNPQDFESIQFLSDLSAVDMSKEGSYRVELLVDGQTVSAILHIRLPIQNTEPSGPIQSAVELRDVVLEAGGSLTPELFLKSPVGANISFVTDVSVIDLTMEGDFPITLRVGGQELTATLRIQDTVAPVGKAVEGLVIRAGILPEPAMLVTDIVDVSKVTLRYAAQPDISAGGPVSTTIILTDAAGNTTELPVSFTVDAQAPVIKGVYDRNFFVDDSISYRSGVEVSDDTDPKPKLTIDNSQVNISVPGKYPVTYTATDSAGNQTVVTVYFTIEAKPEGFVDTEVVYGMARKILNQITTEDMTDMQVAFAIYDWVKSNIGYTGHSDKSSWTLGAYQAFTDYAGDCFTYYAAAKALYEVAGIPNIDVVKVVTENTSRSSHYWSLINLGDGWYHVDCTPRNTPGFFFMNTDEELLAYSVQHKNCHNFDPTAYPPRATESVQHLVDYENKKVNG